MTDVVPATAPKAAAQTDITQMQAPANAPEVMTVTQAARMLASMSRKKPDTPAAPQETEGTAAAEPTRSEAAQANDGDPQQEAPAEQTESAKPEAEALPPIEPPRSWKAEEKERFKSLPRETQAYLAERETERDRAIRTSQNETAEKLKGLTAKEQAVEQARQQYEAALPQLLQTLEN